MQTRHDLLAKLALAVISDTAVLFILFLQIVLIRTVLAMHVLCWTLCRLRVTVRVYTCKRDTLEKQLPSCFYRILLRA